MRILKIKLKRIGRWKKPVYSIIASFKDLPSKSGKSLEKLGFYSPASKPKYFFINFSRVAHWVKRGALLVGTVGPLLSKVAPKVKNKKTFSRRLQ